MNRRTYKTNGLRRVGLGAVLSVAILGCGPGQNQFDALQKEVNLLKLQSRLGWQTALCSRDARLLLSAVQQECESGGCDLEIPKESVISTQVCKLDPKRRERFLEILKEQDQNTFYLYSNSSELSKESRDKLRELVLQTKPLPTTRFLVVTRPWAKESDKQKNARHRGQVVVGEIVKLLGNYFKQDPTSTESKEPESVIRTRRTLLWVYEFPLRPTQAARASIQVPDKKPFMNWTNAVIDAPADDERGVSVFRVDC